MRFLTVIVVGTVFDLGPRFALMVVVAVELERMLFICSRRAIQSLGTLIIAARGFVSF
jgi:hypothetical protein